LRTVTPMRRTSSGRRGSDTDTRLFTLTAAMSALRPSWKVTVMFI
jgi:hypothetical protein